MDPFTVLATAVAEATAEGDRLERPVRVVEMSPEREPKEKDIIAFFHASRVLHFYKGTHYISVLLYSSTHV